MKLADATIRDAYRMHDLVYHGQRLWNVPYHIDCWNFAARAFEEGQTSDFEKLYAELKNRWQALRPTASAAWTPQQTLNHLQQLDQQWRTHPLCDFDDDSVLACHQIVMSMADFKPMKHGPSIVAISKFLHFWNPRLFVIVDYAVIWKWVFAHNWIWREVEEARNGIQYLLGIKEPIGSSCDVLSYIAVLRWSADLIKAHPAIATCFDQYVRKHGTTELPIVEYEAAAVEWLLLGLVELLPEGVRLDAGAH